MSQIESIATTLAKGGFIAAALAYWWLAGRVARARRGARIRPHRLLIIPFFMDAETLTEDGRRHYRWLNRIWVAGMACWGVLLLSMIL
ncbi:hypothetical protein ACO2Q0_19395 [Phenylobacterium sp. VNQ135]|uniref:hypothetical protein n=1 Tax=Phenylobacterium sp. VNQ135 TaxID=3400922 RepID=UPI003C05260C